MQQLKRFRMAMTALAMASIGVSAAQAAPPTAVPSPGYDARLQEQHAAMSRAYVPLMPAPPPRRHIRRKH
jgi:hypothetical protein